MIKIEGLKKSFNSKNERVTVLKGIDLEVQDGDLFGIVGFSGAGKSTLIRCLNGLEKADEGKILINDQDITKLNKNSLRAARKKIGMIFQQFNLFDSKTVYENIAFPLEISGVSKEEIKIRVDEILNLVGLKDKADFYPLQLSGGQKQRVGIARALSIKPDVLLSDEATSALDPETTYSILELLKDINKKLNITIMAGAIGAGGLGSLAIRYGYQRFRTDVLIGTVFVLLIIVQGIQLLGDLIAGHINKKIAKATLRSRRFF